MPRPINYQVAIALEADVRAAGAIPATIYINEGMVHIGTTQESLTMLSEAEDVFKASTRDLAFYWLIENQPVQPLPQLWSA